MELLFFWRNWRENTNSFATSANLFPISGIRLGEILPPFRTCKSTKLDVIPSFTYQGEKWLKLIQIQKKIKITQKNYYC